VAVAGDAVVDAAELLDGGAVQFARMLAPAADDPGLGVQQLETIEPDAAHHQPDGGGSEAVLAGDGRPGSALAG
jgi:hypothetical protein